MAQDLDSAYALGSTEDTKRLYRDWAESYDTTFVESSGYRFPKLVADAYVAGSGRWPCLDVGCGTGAVRRWLPEDAVVDGIDLSAEMLAVANQGNGYRHLVEADLLKPLPLKDQYAGIVSSGTFTHGHVGPEALPPLVALMDSGALAVVSIKTELYPDFREVLDGLEITPPTAREEIIYGKEAPDGHEGDTAMLTTFCKL